jgi:acyl carrier protein phosphodiesterase
LSFDDPEVLAGNLFSDFVKGRRQYDFPPGIRRGIVLHRLIDGFTDDHPQVHEAKQIFRPLYRLYSGAFIDVAFDHFLANDAREFTDESLLAFSKKVYRLAEQNVTWFPARFAGMFPYMKKQNWLYDYRGQQGIFNSFEGLVRRAAYISESLPAVKLMLDNYDYLQQCYAAFWPELKAFARNRYHELSEKENP